MTHIRICPRATQQGRIKCRCHITVPAVPTQDANPEKEDNLKKILFIHSSDLKKIISSNVVLEIMSHSRMGRGYVLPPHHEQKLIYN